MKYLIFCSLVFITSCSNNSSIDKINGIYTTSFSNEFAIGDDTLSVSKANAGKGIYQISKHLGVVNKLDGRAFPRVLVTETWTLKYDAVEQTLFELKSGKTLVWNSTNRSIQLGNLMYKKIKD